MVERRRRRRARASNTRRNSSKEIYTSFDWKNIQREREQNAMRTLNNDVDDEIENNDKQ